MKLYVNVNSVLLIFGDDVIDANSIYHIYTLAENASMYILIYYIYIVAGLSMAGVKMEEYKQIQQCFSNKNHNFSVDLVHIASFTQVHHCSQRSTWSEHT